MMKIDIAKWEKLMYEIVGNLSISDTPIIFKGALITKLVLEENKFDSFVRPTVDIDANWVGTPPDENEMVSSINKAVSNVSIDLFAELTREYSANKSAGITIFDKNTGDPLVEMDISMNKFQESKLYRKGDLVIRGVLPTEILADKISVLSGSKIFRRAKDLVDIYALAHCVEVKTIEIYASHQRDGRVLGKFSEFQNRINDLSHAYQKLRGINNKPDFQTIYDFVSKFIEPFALEYKVDKIWSPQNADWNDVK